MLGRSEIVHDADGARFLKENFVPVALGFLNGGGGNGLGAATPAGETIEGYPDEVLKKWKSMPREDRRKVVDPGLNAPRLPEGGLALRIFMRSLKRGPAGDLSVISADDIRKNPAQYPEWYIDPTERRFHPRIYAEPMGDMLWLTRDEWKSLVPASPCPGDTLPVADSIQKRVIRMHLKDGTRGWVGFWDLKDIRSGKMTLTVEETSPLLRMRLEGSACIAHGDAVIYDPVLGGILEFDPKKQAFTRFDLVAVGDVQGGGGFDRPGRNPLGIAFELSRGDLPMDQAYPLALYFPGRDTYFHAEDR